MNWRNLIERYHAARGKADPLVLATVIHTAGSTYTKPGTVMLFDGAGEYEGLLSGGCFEGDLAVHARAVISERKTMRVSYDMRDREQDELWGLGLGCDGQMDILLQPLDPQNQYEPFATLASGVDNRLPGVLMLVCSKSTPDQTGLAAFVTTSGVVPLGMTEPLLAVASGIARVSKKPHVMAHTVDTVSYDILYVPLQLPLRLLVLGAGPDVVPVVRIAYELGWHVTVADHRAAHLAREEFRLANAAVCVTPATLTDKLLDQNHYDAVIVMSHHLASDRGYLAALMETGIGYIGLLGPAARKVKLLDDIDAPAEFSHRVYGPVGFDIGASGPESIALSIVAEVAAVSSRQRTKHEQ